MSRLHATACNYMGVAYNFEGQRDYALKYLREGLESASFADDEYLTIKLCINIADIERQKGDIVKASQFYRKALRVANTCNENTNVFNICTGLAQIYSDLRNFELSDSNFKLAEQQLDDRTVYEKYIFHNSKGVRYYYQDDYKTAIKCFREAYGFSLLIANPVCKTIVEANMGEMFSLLGQIDSAYYFIDKANIYVSSMDPVDDSFRFYINSIYSYLAIKENKLSKAQKYLNQIYDSTVIGPSYIHLHNKRMMEFYEKNNDYKNAFFYQKEVSRYDDSLRNIQLMRNIAETDMRYSQDTTILKQDILIAKAKVMTSKVINWALLVTISLIMVIMITSMSILYLRKNNRESYMRQLEMINGLRMENVRNRMSPHFMFNVLNSLLPSFSNNRELYRPLVTFINMMRNNLVASENLVTSLSCEMQLVDNFVALRRLTYINTPAVNWKIDSDINLSCEIISMMIQIPVENALKYAFVGREDNKDNFIIISITQSEKFIKIKIKDNGIGFNPSAFYSSTKGTGNGLKMLYKTIEIINSKNTDKISFQIGNVADFGDQSSGTLVKIEIPKGCDYYYEKYKSLV